MQLILRYIEEVSRGKNKREASKTLIEAMFAPGITSIITDAFGVALVACAAIPILQKIAITCFFWSVVTVVFSLIFTPVFLAVFPESKKLRSHIVKGYEEMQKEGLLERILSRMGFWIVKKGKWVVVCLTVLITGLSLYYSLKIEVGDFVPGSSVLWPDHRYNKDALRIAYSMPLLNPIYVIMKAGEGQWSLESPEVIKAMEKFQRHAQRHRRVALVQSIINQLPTFWSGMKDGDPNYSFIPHEPNLISYSLKGLIYRSRPGDWSGFVKDRKSVV